MGRLDILLFFFLICLYLWDIQRQTEALAFVMNIMDTCCTNPNLKQAHIFRTQKLLAYCNLEVVIHILGVSDKWSKSKYQNFKSTQWFSYKIRTKNSEKPIVYLHNWPLPEQHHFLKIQWEIHFFIFLNTDQNAPKNFRTKI